MVAKFPAENNDEAVALAIQTSNQFHDVVQGSIIETIPTYEGNGNIPSVAKALYDAAAYKVPIDWSSGSTETELMQPRIYNDNIYVPIQVPALMDPIPDDTKWRLYSQFHPYRSVIQKESQTGADISGGVSTLTTIEYPLGVNSLIVIVDGSIVDNYTETSTTSITWDSGTEPTALQQITFLAGNYVSVDTIYDEIIVARNQAVAAARSTITTDATTAYSVLAADENVYRRFTSGSGITVTVDLNATEAIDIGAAFHFNQAGAGQITVAGAVGVTVNSASTLTSRTQYSGITLIKVGTDEWDLIGDLG